MKRWLMVGAALTALICVCAALNGTITDPADFTGIWYRAEDGALCLFAEGIIVCPDSGGLLPDGAFSGAYAFAGEKAAVFLLTGDGVSQTAELYLVHDARGDYLCQTENGTGRVWFCRDREAARNAS